MAGMTLEIAQAKLDGWLAADDAIQKGQSYTIQGSIGARSLTRAEAREVRANVDYWSKVVARLQRGGIPVQHAVPR